LQGRLQLEAIKAAVPSIVRCTAYDIVAAHAERYQCEMSGRFGVDIEIVPTAETAVRGADIVMSSGPIQKNRTPAIDAGWIAPGCLYLSLDRDSYIADDAIRSMDLVLSDDREALFHAREHEGAFAAVARVDVDLAELAGRSAPARQGPDERIAVFVNGLGIEDLAAAVEVYRLAGERGAGLVLASQAGEN
jgi:ornithine cyclodeaminase/alanine dehydrogenase-like protein (mu-crystallin family)